MVLKQVKPLHKLSLEVTKKYVITFLDQHCVLCKICSTDMEKCSTFNGLREMLQLPPKYLQILHDEVLNGLLKQEVKSFALIGLSTLLFFPDLKITKYIFSPTNCNLSYLENFGKHVKSISYERDGCHSQKKWKMRLEVENLISQSGNSSTRMQPLTNYRNFSELFSGRNVSVWESVLLSCTNISILNLDGANIDEKILVIIGKKCDSLEVLKGVLLNENSMDYKSFEKFCFHDYPSNTIQNKCCHTLQVLELDFQIYFGNGYDLNKLKIIRVLLQNIPNLETLGVQIYLDWYLTSLKPYTIRETNLQEIMINCLSVKLFPLLEAFCPKLKKLIVHDMDIDATESIHDCSLFSRLESFTDWNDLVLQQDMQYRAFTSFNLALRGELQYREFISLRELSLIYTNHVNFTDLACNLPKLEKFCITGTKMYRGVWDGSTYFKALKDVTIDITGCHEISDIQWISSFANTIQFLTIHSNRSRIFRSFLWTMFPTISFPLLEVFAVNSFFYAFDFVSDMLRSCPKIQHIKKLNEVTLDLKRKLLKVLKDNNLECCFD